MRKFLLKILALIIFIAGTMVAVCIGIFGGETDAVLDLWHGAAIELWEDK